MEFPMTGYCWAGTSNYPDGFATHDGAMTTVGQTRQALSFHRAGGQEDGAFTICTHQGPWLERTGKCL